MIERWTTRERARGRTDRRRSRTPSGPLRRRCSPRRATTPPVCGTSRGPPVSTRRSSSATSGRRRACSWRPCRCPPCGGKCSTGPVDQVGHAITRLIMSGREGGLGPYAALIRASDRPEVAEKLRRALIEDFVIPLAARLDGEDAELRAHLFTAQVQGLMDVLAVRPDQFLLDTPADVIVRWYGAALQRTLTGAP